MIAALAAAASPLQVQGKVLKKLAKKHGDGLDMVHVAELLQQLLASSRCALQKSLQQCRLQACCCS